MDHRIATPVLKKEIVYPDRGGYTGFSICVWYVSLENPWGGIGAYVTEGRFFVFGSLLKRILEIEDSIHEPDTSKIFNKWKPLMDWINKKEKQLWGDGSGRTGIHIDEILKGFHKERL